MRKKIVSCAVGLSYLNLNRPKGFRNIAILTSIVSRQRSNASPDKGEQEEEETICELNGLLLG